MNRCGNREFGGDVIIIHDGPAEEHREVLNTLSGRVRLAPVSPELRDRLARVGAAAPCRASPRPA